MKATWIIRHLGSLLNTEHLVKIVISAVLVRKYHNWKRQIVVVEEIIQRISWSSVQHLQPNVKRDKRVLHEEILLPSNKDQHAPYEKIRRTHENWTTYAIVRPRHASLASRPNRLRWSARDELSYCRAARFSTPIPVHLNPAPTQHGTLTNLPPRWRGLQDDVFLKMSRTKNQLCAAKDDSLTKIRQMVTAKIIL